MDRNTKIYLEIERSKLKRERDRVVMEKSIFLYFLFMMVAILGFVFKYIDILYANLLVVFGIIVLLIGVIPYTIRAHKDEKFIDSLLK
jgi:hypothetical protein